MNVYNNEKFKNWLYINTKQDSEFLLPTTNAASEFPAIQTEYLEMLREMENNNNKNELIQDQTIISRQLDMENPETTEQPMQTTEPIVTTSSIFKEDITALNKEPNQQTTEQLFDTQFTSEATIADTTDCIKPSTPSSTSKPASYYGGHQSNDEIYITTISPLSYKWISFYDNMFKPSQEDTSGNWISI